MAVLGIDVGGTKTVCVLADAGGNVVASARGPGANLQAVGAAVLDSVLGSVIAEVSAGRGMALDAICLGIAGVDRPEDTQIVREILARHGYSARVLIVNDALIALQAGVGSGPGVVIVAGTGSMVYGRSAAGQVARAGGWGYVLGDEGSGFWIGRLALRAVVRSADARGAATSLTPKLLAHFGVTREPELIRKVYQEHLPPRAIAALAHFVEEARAEGDRVALTILQAAANELVLGGAAVATRLAMTAERFTFVLSGGVFHAVPWLCDRLSELLPASAPLSTTRRLDIEPAMGAVDLAIAEIGGGAPRPNAQSAPA